MEPGDVQSQFEDFSTSSFVGDFTVPATGDLVRLKGLSYACSTNKRGRIVVKNGTTSGDTLMTMVLIGNASNASGIIQIPGNGILATNGLFVDVQDDGESSGGGLRSVTIFYQS
jgi:hypothetical protein